MALVARVLGQVPGTANSISLISIPTVLMTRFVMFRVVVFCFVCFGIAPQVTEKESTEYFQSRPRGSQVGAWALHQSRPVESRGSLETNVKDVQVRGSVSAVRV